MNDKQYWDRIWTEHPDMRVNRMARRALPLIKARGLQTVLDIGCGSGQDALYMVRHGLQVTALDIAPAGLQRLQELKAGVTCLNQDISQLNLPDESFEVVYAHLSLQYFDDRQTRRVFRTIYNILKKGGLFLVKCKSVDDRLYGEGEKVGEDTFFYHHLRHFFSRNYMAAMLEPFSIIKLRRTSSVYGGQRSAFIEAIATRQTT